MLSSSTNQSVPQHDSAFDHYGKFLATCSSDKRIRIFDVSGDVHVPVAEILK